MNELFIRILNMSITASYVALAVLFVRLLLHKAPKKYSYVLWSFVLFRLFCPFSFQSMFSLFGLFHSTNEFIPQDIGMMQQPALNTGITGVNTIINNSLPAATPASSVNPMQVIAEIAAGIWIIGMGALIVYGIISYWSTKNRIRHATLVRDNIFETDQFRTPFVLGFIRPKIFIPSHITPEEYTCVLQHEQTHIRRFDLWVKPLAFITLAIHWFNPLMWLCYRLMSRDMEMSCDERVMKCNDSDMRETYSRFLLSLSTRQSGLLSPLAFGESHVKSRIKNVLNYRKPTFWISALVLIAVIVFSVPLLSNAVQQKEPSSSIINKETPMKGLELYVWKNKELMGNSDTYYTLLLGTNRNKVQSEIYSRDNAVNSIDKVNEMLAKYSAETQLFIYQMNATDFTKEQMMAISDQLKLPTGNESKAIGLWQGTPSMDEITSLEPSAAIDKCLEIILSSPQYSSNSQDYIDAHQYEYQTILKYGDVALNHLLLQFKTGENNGLRGVIMMGLCKEILGDRNNVADTSLLPQAWFNALSIRIEVELPDFVYSGKDPIERLVYDTELKQYYNYGHAGFNIIALKIHGSYKEGNKLKVFVTTYSTTYQLYDKVLSQTGGSIVPAAMTFTKNADGSYSLIEYIQAKDGAENRKSIQDYCTMPESGKKIAGLADQILSYGIPDELKNLERENLIMHLKANHQTGIIFHSSTGEMIPLT